jgi:hypothetical protein
MVSTDAALSAGGGSGRRVLAVLPVFVASLFLSALLLFAIQPMFTKMVLPLLGGSPSVWSVAMVFFQTVLLGGYIYAHLVVTKLGLRTGAVLHVLLLAGTILTLPFAVPAWALDPPAEGQSLWLLGLFAASVGLPFFAVAGNGPLLQAWFARSGHAQARDPYFLYGASNLGSLAALLLYPALAEPLLTLGEQRALWSAGFALLAGSIMLCALAVPFASGAGASAMEAADAGPASSWKDRAVWIGLSFVPSALLVAVTSHLSTDVAAVPLLWVMPLALFLLTFILAFAERPLVAPWLMLKIQPWLIGSLAYIAALGTKSILLTTAFVLTGLFVSAMVAHSELYKTRPRSGRLTEFYLWMSLGGVLGGVFTGLLAPAIFSRVAEYPILLALTLLCRPAFRAASLRTWLPTAILIGGSGVGLAALLGGTPEGGFMTIAVMILLVLLMATVMLSGQRCGLMIGSAVALLSLSWVTTGGTAGTQTTRSFFGVHRVQETADGQFRLLAHGTTIHGAQRIRTKEGAPYLGPPIPATYYFRGGSIAQAIDAARSVKGKLAHVAAVGLGTGSLACHRMPGEDWRFYEIDPEVVRIAKDPAQFRFLSDCAPAAAITLGDARLTLARETERFDLIVLDAFSSDAIPVHLLTKEALEIYRRKLTPDGLVVYHLSNRHMNLIPFVARTAAELALMSYSQLTPATPALEDDFFSRSMVLVVGAKAADFGPVTDDAAWTRMEPDPAIRAWTDDYSNVLAAIWSELRR